MDAESTVQYQRLLPEHDCSVCSGPHRLQEYPVNGGYIVAVVCAGGCRTKTGLPRLYSTETVVYPTLERATEAKCDLLMGPPPEPLGMKNIGWCPLTNTWVVRIRRGEQKYRQRFEDVHEAMRARDEWLEAA